MLKGHKVFKGNVQYHKTSVKYFGWRISKKELLINADRVERPSSLPCPEDKKTIKGIFRTCRLLQEMDPNFLKLLSHCIIEQDQPEPLCWKVEHSEGKETLKEFLTKAPAWEHPNYKRPVSLSVPEKRGTALGALTQQRGGYC